MLVLLIKRYKKTKIVFKYWSILVMIGSSLKVIGGILKLFTGEELELQIESIISSIIMVLIGFIVYSYNERDVYVGFPKKGNEKMC